VGRFEKGAKKKTFWENIQIPGNEVIRAFGRWARSQARGKFARVQNDKNIRPDTNSLESCWLFTVAVTGHCQVGERQSRKKTKMRIRSTIKLELNCLPICRD